MQKLRTFGFLSVMRGIKRNSWTSYNCYLPIPKLNATIQTHIMAFFATNWNAHLKRLDTGQLSNCNACKSAQFRPIDYLVECANILDSACMNIGLHK